MTGKIFCHAAVACVLDCGSPLPLFHHLWLPATTFCPCPSRTSDNSQHHARVIYGWVQRLTKSQSPAGTPETLLRFAGISSCSGGSDLSFFHSVILSKTLRLCVFALEIRVTRACLASRRTLPPRFMVHLTGQKPAVWTGKLNKKNDANLFCP
jgi:hypothetical protein